MNLKLDPKAPAEEIAQAILSQANRSTPLDFRSTGLGPLLEGAQGDRSIPKYVEIFQCVFNGTNEPLIRLRAQAEVLGALRRDPNNDLRDLLRQLSELEQEVTPTSANECDLLSTIAYNRGIALRSPRLYGDATRAQEVSTFWKIGSAAPVRAFTRLIPKIEQSMTGIFLGAIERTTVAIVEGKEVEQNLQHLRNLREIVQTICKILGVSFPGWMAANADIHIWGAHLWADLVYPEMEADEDSILKRPGNQVNGWSQCVMMAKMLRDGSYEQLDEASAQATALLTTTPGSSVSNTLLTVQLLDARTAIICGATDLAKASYTKIVNWTGTDGGGPMAAARRELLALG